MCCIKSADKWILELEEGGTSFLNTGMSRCPGRGNEHSIDVNGNPAPLHPPQDHWCSLQESWTWAWARFSPLKFGEEAVGKAWCPDRLYCSYGKLRIWEDCGKPTKAGLPAESPCGTNMSECSPISLRGSSSREGTRDSRAPPSRV